MFKSVFLLTKIQLLNAFGINEARFAKDEKKKKNVKMTLIAFIIVGITLAVYSATLSQGLAVMGYMQIVPLYLGLLATGLIFSL